MDNGSTNDGCGSVQNAAPTAPMKASSHEAFIFYPDETAKVIETAAIAE